jgi:hypothetical protein
VTAAAGLAGPGSFDSSLKLKSNRCSFDFGSYLIVAAALNGSVDSCWGILASSVLPSREGANEIVASSLSDLSRTTSDPLKFLPASGFLKLS